MAYTDRTVRITLIGTIFTEEMRKVSVQGKTKKGYGTSEERQIGYRDKGSVKKLGARAIHPNHGD